MSRGAGQFTRGALADRETTRWDSLSRKSGYYAKRAVLAGARGWPAAGGTMPFGGTAHEQVA